MYRIYLLILVSFFSSNFFSQDLLYDWAVNFEGESALRGGQSIAVDSSGNIYTTGSFEGTVDFDPGVGVTNLTSAGNKDIFIQKLDSSGSLIWVNQFGSTNLDEGVSVTLDSTGNIYVLGNFRDTIDFDSGPGTSILTSFGGIDIFLQKLDSNGNLVWVKQVGGTAHDPVDGFTIDLYGNIYVTGSFAGYPDFDPGVGTANLPYNGLGDAYVLKLDNNGDFIWVKHIGGSGYDRGRSIKTDASGNVYTVGQFNETVDFDPGVGTVYLTPNGSTDLFVQKLDSNGNFIWVRQIGGIGSELSYSVTTDVFGNVCTIGRFEETVDFDPGVGTANLISNGNSDIFIQKLDTNGDLVWAKQMGGLDYDLGISITTDSIGSIYSTGLFNGTVDFNPGIGVANLTSSGDLDAFIQKLNSNGDFVWAKKITGINRVIGYSIQTDVKGSVYTAGVFTGTADFDPSTGTANFTYSSGYSVYIGKFNQCSPSSSTDIVSACDSYTWMDGNIYTTSNNTATHILTNSAGCDSVINLQLTIYEQSTAFDTIVECNNSSYTWIDGVTYTSSNNTATHTLTNAVGCDSIVTLNLTFANPSTGTAIITACDSYTWIDGNTYTSSNNTATHTLTNAAGCDSIVTLNLTITQSSSGVDMQSACETFIWIDGNTYTSSNNTATHTLTNAAGCDSIVTLNLTINQPVSVVYIQSACDSFTWIDGNTYTSSNNTATYTLISAAGCDSVLNLNLTIKQSTSSVDTHSACDSYTWIDGATYTSSNNTATYLLTNAEGCDSVITLDLTINSVSDLTTNLNGNVITADNPNANYQWLDCDDNYSNIIGENNQFFAPTSDGDYAVELTENGCVDTSDCITYSTVGIIKNNFGDELIVYPNPTEGNFFVDLGKSYQSAEISVSDINGRLIRSVSFDQEQKLSMWINETKGVYLITINADDKMAVIRLVKN